jgi:hypothetical protein
MRNVMPQRTFMLCTGELPPPYDCGDIVTAPLQKIFTTGDLGTFMNLRNKEKDFRFCGWYASILALAMLAYNDEADMLYQEQDCLVFGDCIGRIYSELGSASVMIGSMPGQPCAQSLFFVKHNYLPEFVRLLCGQGPQSEPGQLGEEIFQRLEERHPLDWKRFSFPYDRQRPLPVDQPMFAGKCWYAQKFSPKELTEMKATGLVTFDKLPEGVEVFSSTPHK